MAGIKEVVCAPWLSQGSGPSLGVACPTVHHEHHHSGKCNTKPREHFQTKSLVLRFYFNVFTCKTKPVLINYNSHFFGLPYVLSSQVHVPPKLA